MTTFQRLLADSRTRVRVLYELAGCRAALVATGNGRVDGDARGSDICVSPALGSLLDDPGEGDCDVAAHVPLLDLSLVPHRWGLEESIGREWLEIDVEEVNARVAVRRAPESFPSCRPEARPCSPRS